ncbi:hypothetical protein [Saprospira grandis]|uniref:Uncharacterized protein n=1 Tax=Saprospira grandis (strain Lewin) TaxID=984262 RepID=H6L3T8_SAPGL|nr:hypothetical protein [Saprospira grandis]AFC22773.1 hypothetical protein SGRA_0028 [Saprospira grandis str. Lewin]
MAELRSTHLHQNGKKVWRLQALSTEVYDVDKGGMVTTDLVDFNDSNFTSRFGGYVPVQITFYDNRNFEVLYHTADGPIEGNGRWTKNADHIVLQQNTGDEIELPKAVLAAEDQFHSQYAYLGGNMDIQQLKYRAI